MRSCNSHVSLRMSRFYSTHIKLSASAVLHWPGLMTWRSLLLPHMRNSLMKRLLRSCALCIAFSLVLGFVWIWKRGKRKRCYNTEARRQRSTIKSPLSSDLDAYLFRPHTALQQQKPFGLSLTTATLVQYFLKQPHWDKSYVPEQGRRNLCSSSSAKISLQTNGWQSRYGLHCWTHLWSLFSCTVQATGHCYHTDSSQSWDTSLLAGTAPFVELDSGPHSKCRTMRFSQG